MILRTICNYTYSQHMQGYMCTCTFTATCMYIICLLAYCTCMSAWQTCRFEKWRGNSKRASSYLSLSLFPSFSFLTLCLLSPSLSLLYATSLGGKRHTYMGTHRVHVHSTCTMYMHPATCISTGLVCTCTCTYKCAVQCDCSCTAQKDVHVTTYYLYTVHTQEHVHCTMYM